MTKELKEKNQKIEEISLLKERSRMAREIHDTLGHTLTGAIIQLEAAKKLIYIDQDKTLLAIEKTQQINRDGFLEVKRAIHALRPVLIEDGNLKDALEALFEKVENDCHVLIDRHIKGDGPIEAASKVSLYRIIQESITNSIRHGQASRIDLSLENKDEHIEVTMHDNGLGCEMIQEGNGLKGIRERVYSHQGRLEIKSKVNEGFHLKVFIPK
jgi:signal transduction histidine kinase